MELRPIAHIGTDFPEKFGIPRQSGRVPELRGRIIFEKEFRDPDFIRRRNPEGKFRSSGTSAGMCSSGL